jgi:hypothetical protein
LKFWFFSKICVGELGLGQVAKCMIEGDFHRFTGPIAEGFSGRQFALVVEPLDSRAGEAS